MSFARYLVHPIGANTYAIEEKTPLSQGLCYLLLGSERALLIDTCLGYAPLKATIDRLTNLPVIVVITHAHLDHMRGNHFFPEAWMQEDDAEVYRLHTDPSYASSLIRREMPAWVSALLGGVVRNLVQMDMTVQPRTYREHTFELGDRSIEVIHTPGHSPGSVCLLDRANRMLFSGDTLCEWGVLLHLDGSRPPEEFYRSLLRLEALSDAYDTVWPGHHGFPVDKSYLGEYLACARSILDKTATLERNPRDVPFARYQRVLITLPEDTKTHDA